MPQTDHTIKKDVTMDILREVAKVKAYYDTQSFKKQVMDCKLSAESKQAKCILLITSL